MKVLLTMIGLSVCNYVLAQTKEELSIKVEWATKKQVHVSEYHYQNNYPSISPNENKDNYHLARFEIINNQDTTLPVSIWTCSWYRNWRSDNNSIFMNPWDCDGNYPDTINILSKKSLVYYGYIYIGPGNKIKSFKMGFASWNKNSENILFGKMNREPKGKFYWSNSIVIKPDQTHGNTQKTK